MRWPPQAEPSMGNALSGGSTLVAATGEVRVETVAPRKLAAVRREVHAWCKAQGRVIAALSWELYGDWTDDESKLETTVFYLLK